MMPGEQFASSPGAVSSSKNTSRTARNLRRRGFAVAVMDWRGQGHSSRQLPDPRKGHVASFAEYEIDVETFMQRVVIPHCPPPYVALAHSMGGAVMLRVAHSGRRLVRAYGSRRAADRSAATARLLAVALADAGAAPCGLRQ
jgi:alpha-beta hydrolase superfamily lysophospholipase